MTIIVKIEPTVRAGEHTSHFVAVFHFDGKNFVDSGKRLEVGVMGYPNDIGEEPLYVEGRAVLLVEGWRDGSMESGERCPDIIPLIDRYKKPDSKPVSGEVAIRFKCPDCGDLIPHFDGRVDYAPSDSVHCKGCETEDRYFSDFKPTLIQAAQPHHPAEDSKPQEVKGLVEALEFYADKENYQLQHRNEALRISRIKEDEGETATEALKTFKGEK